MVSDPGEGGEGGEAAATGGGAPEQDGSSSGRRADLAGIKQSPVM